MFQFLIGMISPWNFNKFTTLGPSRSRFQFLIGMISPGLDYGPEWYHGKITFQFLIGMIAQCHYGKRVPAGLYVRGSIPHRHDSTKSLHTE